MDMQGPVRIQRMIFFVSFVLFVGKLLAWYLTHSVAILTDALESIVNLIAGLIGWYSIVFASRPRDANHPYGHGKAEYISSAIEGTLIVIAGIVIIYESVKRLLVPAPVEALEAGMVITAAAGLANLFVGRYAVSRAKYYRSATVEAAGRHLQTDAWSSFALVAGLILLIVTGQQWIDSAVALVFAGLILRTGYQVIRKSLAGIMDETDTELMREVIRFLQAERLPQWIDLHNLRVIQYGSMLHMDAHLTVPWYYQVRDAEREMHNLEGMIREHFGGKVELFVHIDACMPYQCGLCSVPECPERSAPFEKQVIWNEMNVWQDRKHGRPED